MKHYLKFFSVKAMTYPRMPYFTRQAYYIICTYFSPWTTHLIEVFTRKDFGVRHFNMGVSMRLAFILAGIPLIPLLGASFLNPPIDMKDVPVQLKEQVAKTMERTYHFDIVPYILWYAFIAAFVTMCWFHWRDQISRPPIFEKPRHTRYAGTPHRWFYKIKFQFLETNILTIESIFEPALFFIPGLICLLIGQKIGLLLIVTAALYRGYSLGNYWMGQQAVMNTYDKMIENRWDAEFMELFDKESSKMDFPDVPMDEKEFQDNFSDEMDIPTHRTSIVPH